MIHFWCSDLLKLIVNANSCQGFVYSAFMEEGWVKGVV